MIIKTDWIKTDYINADDFNRIVSNLNEVRGFASPLTISLADLYTMFKTNEEIVLLSSFYNRIAKMSGFATQILQERVNFFNFIELNKIESLCKEIINRNRCVAYCGQSVFSGQNKSGGGYLNG